MSQYFADWDERTLDLALEAFTHGVGASELQELKARASSEELSAFEMAIAAIHWASLGPAESVPVGLNDRLETQAHVWMRSINEDARMVSETGSSTYPEPPSVAEGSRLRPMPATRIRTPWGGIVGWALAASLFVVLVTRRNNVALPSTLERMQHLVAHSADLQRIEWSATEDPLAQGASGEVVWSAAQQEGYMVFRGLAANNPEHQQYQLWIFDPTRADWEALPVDGGVFDVNAISEVIVPIQAKLPVQKAALFAITLEKPGGVVVSKREHLLLTAAAPS